MNGSHLPGEVPAEHRAQRGEEPRALRQLPAPCGPCLGPSPSPAVSVSSALLGFADSPAPCRHAVAGEEEDGAPGPGPAGAPAGLVRARIAGLVSLPGLTDREDPLLGEQG